MANFGIDDNRTGYFISSDDIRKRLEEVKKLDLEAKEPEYNLIVLKTPTGDIKIKTKLSKEEWLKKHKANSKKKDIQLFEEGKDEN